VSPKLQARDRGDLRERTGKAGKCGLDGTGKYRVDRFDEGIFANVSIRDASQSLTLVMAGLDPAIHDFIFL
jgi:hypothetical protein